MGTSTLAPVSRTADCRSNVEANAASVDAVGAVTGIADPALVHAPAVVPATRHCTCAVTAVAPPRGGPPADTTTLPDEVAPAPGDVNDAASPHPNPYVTAGEVFNARDTALAVIPCAPLAPTFTVTVVFATAGSALTGTVTRDTGAPSTLTSMNPADDASPTDPAADTVHVTVDDDGALDNHVPSVANGAGHETTGTGGALNAVVKLLHGDHVPFHNPWSSDTAVRA